MVLVWSKNFGFYVDVEFLIKCVQLEKLNVECKVNKSGFL